MKRINSVIAALATMWQIECHATAQEKVPQLIKSLESTRKLDRLEGMKALGKEGTAAKEAIPILSKHLRHQDTDLADRAAQTLAQVGRASVSELVSSLKDSSASVRKRALVALGLLGPQAHAAVSAVTPFLEDADPKMRSLAARVLGEIGPSSRSAAASLGNVLRDADTEVRQCAAQALRDIGPETVALLVPITRDQDRAVRLNALGALLMFHEREEAVRALADAMRDKEVKVRAAAAAGLLHFGPAARTAIPDLFENLKEPNLELQMHSFTALLAIGSPKDSEFCNRLAAINEEKRWTGPYVLKQFGTKPKDCVRGVLRFVDNPDVTLRIGAILALARIGPEAKEATPRLQQMVAESNTLIRAAALLALARIDVKRQKEQVRVLKLIEDLLQDLKAEKRPNVDEVIQLHILASCFANSGWSEQSLDDVGKERLGTVRNWTSKALDESVARPFVLPAFVRGVNTCARFNLGFTEPCGRLSLMMNELAKESKSSQELGYAFVHLADGVAKTSPYWGPVQHNLFQVYSNTLFWDGLIVGQRQDQVQSLLTGELLNVNELLVRRCGDHRRSIVLQMRAQAGQQNINTILQLKTSILWPKLWKESAEELVKRLDDPDPSVRWVTANIIGRKRIPAEKELIVHLTDPSREVREGAHQALVRLGRGTDFGPNPLDSQAKIERAVQRWNEWLSLQDDIVSPGSGSPRDTPLPKSEPRPLDKSKKERESP